LQGSGVLNLLAQQVQPLAALSGLPTAASHDYA
jgi:hypothetical protein